jgi:hypothetical protein
VTIVETSGVEETVVGMARVVGDGGSVYHICDMVVHPDHQRQGLGSRLLDALMAWVHETRQYALGNKGTGGVIVSEAVVDITGHLAFGLLFALPAWWVLDDRASVGFVALTAVAALLPDIDLWLAMVFPAQVHHHGVTHTVLFAGGASLVGGAVVAGLLCRQVDSWIGERVGARALFISAAVAVFAGTLSHLSADMLSAPDISTPIEPFWPLFAKPWSVDLVWYNATWINYGFFAVMVTVHVVVAYLTTPTARRHRLNPL